MPARVTLRPRDTDHVRAPNWATCAWHSNYGRPVSFLDYLPILLTVLSTLGIGTFIGQYLLGGQQRREVRSRVLSALEDVEGARFGGDGGSTFREFRRTIQQLEASALVARIPRPAVEDYVFLATTAWRTCNPHPDDYYAPDEEPPWISRAFNSVVIEAAGDVARYVWHPVTGGFRFKDRVADRRKRVIAEGNEDVVRTIKTSQDPVAKQYGRPDEPTIPVAPPAFSWPENEATAQSTNEPENEATAQAISDPETETRAQ